MPPTAIFRSPVSGVTFVNGGATLYIADYQGIGKRAVCFSFGHGSQDAAIKSDWLSTGRDETTPTWVFNEAATAMMLAFAAPPFGLVPIASLAALAAEYAQFADYLQVVGDSIAAGTPASGANETWMPLGINDWTHGNPTAEWQPANSIIIRDLFGGVGGVPTGLPALEFPALIVDPVSGGVNAYVGGILPTTFTTITFYCDMVAGDGWVPGSPADFAIGIAVPNDNGDTPLQIPVAPPFLVPFSTPNLSGFAQDRHVSVVLGTIDKHDPPPVPAAGMPFTLRLVRTDAEPGAVIMVRAALRFQ